MSYFRAAWPRYLRQLGFPGFGMSVGHPQANESWFNLTSSQPRKTFRAPGFGSFGQCLTAQSRRIRSFQWLHTPRAGHTHHKKLLERLGSGLLLLAGLLFLVLSGLGPYEGGNWRTGLLCLVSSHHNPKAAHPSRLRVPYSGRIGYRCPATRGPHWCCLSVGWVSRTCQGWFYLLV